MWNKQIHQKQMKQKLLSSSFQYRQQDPDYKGQILDVDYTEDPVQKRSCTDLLCCILFLLLIAFMGYVAVKAFQTGNPELLAEPFDQDKNQCGRDIGYQDYKKVYISNFVLNITEISFVCVKQCPINELSKIDCKNTSKVKTCDELKVYQSSTAVNICLPSIQIDFDFEKFNVSVLQQYFSDLRDAKFLVLAMIGISFVISVLYTFLMRCFAGCFLWSFIVIFISFLTVVGTASLTMSRIDFLKKLLDYDSLPQNLKNQNYQITCGVLCLASAFITFVIVCCMKRQIKISIGIIKAASDFVRQCWSALLIPLYISILQSLFIALWVAVMLFLFSSNDADLEPINKTPFSMIVWNQDIQKLTIVYIIGLIWIVFFLEGLGAYLTSSTVAIWYFESGQPSSPIIRSFCRSIKSMGSIAFGSFLLTFVTVIRVILEYINTKAKKSTIAMNDGQAAAANFVIKCASCFIACFERIIRFLTENAYIMMAITGKNFCSSASESFYLILRCAGQFAISHSTTKFFIGLGKAFIVTVCCVIGYIFITSIEPYKSQIYEPISLTIAFAIASYPIASAFMLLFETAANTLLVCYCIEIDLSKGRSRCPTQLRVFLQDYVQSSSLMDEVYNNKK